MQVKEGPHEDVFDNRPRSSTPQKPAQPLLTFIFPSSSHGQEYWLGVEEKTAHECTKDNSGASKVSAFAEKISYFNKTPWMPTVWKIFVF